MYLKIAYNAKGMYKQAKENLLNAIELEPNNQTYSEELDRLTSLSEDDLHKIIYSYEDLGVKDDDTAKYIFEQLKPSYEVLLQVSYL